MTPTLATLLAFGLPSGMEWPAIIFIVLLLFGAKKLPELARGIGRSLGEFKKARDEFSREIEAADREVSQENTSRPPVNGAIPQDVTTRVASSAKASESRSDA
jgi:sec-independent protein translocase protein TatA